MFWRRDSPLVSGPFVSGTVPAKTHLRPVLVNFMPLLPRYSSCYCAETAAIVQLAEGLAKKHKSQLLHDVYQGPQHSRKCGDAPTPPATLEDKLNKLDAAFGRPL